MKFLKYFIFFAIFLYLFSGFFHKISAMTQDLGRHFLIGKIVLDTWHVPMTNLFSYTYPDFPFVNLHWFSEVIFYLIFKTTGFNGILVISTIVVLLAFAILLFGQRKENLIVIAIGSMLYFGVFFERTDIRPEIFSFLFLAIFVSILYSYRQKFTKLVFLLPLIQLFWVNMHIYFAIGIAVIGLFLLEDFILNYKEILEGLKRYKLPKKTQILFLVLILTITASLFNPHGLIGLLYPFVFSQNYGYTIEENQNIIFIWNIFHDPAIAYFWTSSLLLFLGLILNVKKSRLIDWFLFLFFSGFAIWAVRNLPLFAFATFIAFTYNYSVVIKRLSLKLEKPLLLLSLLLLSFMIMTKISDPSFGFGVVKGAERGADFFIQNNLKGPIYNNFDIGSYLDYRLYPRERVFIDGRPGEYPVSFFQKVYIPMQESDAVFEQVDKKYGFQTIFLNYLDQTPWAQAFLKQIVNNPNWKMVYLDDYVSILVKNNKQNKEIIERFGFSKENIQISNFDSKDKDSLIHLAVFFNEIGLTDQELKTEQAILSIDPNFCPALNNVSIILSSKGDPSAQIYSNRFQQVCR